MIWGGEILLNVTQAAEAVLFIIMIIVTIVVVILGICARERERERERERAAPCDGIQVDLEGGAVGNAQDGSILQPLSSWDFYSLSCLGVLGLEEEWVMMMMNSD